MFSSLTSIGVAVDDAPSLGATNLREVGVGRGDDTLDDDGMMDEPNAGRDGA